MSVDIDDVATALQAILDPLVDVDHSSLSEYTPAIRTQKAALLIVAFEQNGAMAYASLNGGSSLVHAHRMVCEFWIKANPGEPNASMNRARNVCLQALRLIAANPTLNGTVMKVGSSLLGEGGLIGRYDVLPRFEERNNIPYIIARLWVPVEIREVASW